MKIRRTIEQLNVDFETEEYIILEQYVNKNENKWKASFKNMYLGTFNTFEDASHARDLAEENQI